MKSATRFRLLWPADEVYKPRKSMKMAFMTDNSPKRRAVLPRLVTALAFILLILNAPSQSAAQALPRGPSPLIRRYCEGEALTYRMTGINEQWRFEIQAEGVVKRDPAGAFVEVYRWSKKLGIGIHPPDPGPLTRRPSAPSVVSHVAPP
jgi:hypothetical protein